VLLGEHARWRHGGERRLQLILPSAHHIALAAYLRVEDGLGDVSRVIFLLT
jgi:hypothetical protein